MLNSLAIIALAKVMSVNFFPFSLKLRSWFIIHKLNLTFLE